MPNETLRASIIRLAHANPAIRADILPLVTDRVAEGKRGPGSVWKTEGGNWRAMNDKGEAKSFGDDQEAAKAHAGKGGKSKKNETGSNVDPDVMEARRPSISDDLKEYGTHVSVDALKPEHREAIKDYNLEVVGTDAAQAVEIARKIKEGIKKGSDICKMNPPVCEGNKGLTRDKMPQIEGEKTVKQMLEAVKKDGTPDEEARAKGKAMVEAGADPKSDKTIMQTMIDHFKKNGVKTRRTKIPVGMLKATQSEIKAEKTYGMADAHLKGKFPNIGDSVVVSRDGHILDGHHRWAALLTIDPSRDMNVQVIDMDMDDLLKEAQAIPGVYKADFEGKPLDESEQKKYKSEATTKFNAKGKRASADVQAAYNAAMDADRAQIEAATIRLAHTRPDLRAALHPVLGHIRTDRAVRAAVAGSNEIHGKAEAFWRSVDNAVRERDFARRSNMMDGINALILKMTPGQREELIEYIQWAAPQQGWGRGTNSDQSAILMLKHPQRTASRVPKGTPTHVNLWALSDTLRENGGRVPARMPAVRVPHLRRCLAAGLIEEVGGGFALTPLGAKMLSDAGLPSYQ